MFSYYIMLTNVDIEGLAKRMNIPLAFVGFKDDLPRTIKPNQYYIINLEDAEMESGKQNSGSHWTGFQVRAHGNGSKPEAMYFDSYGAPPPQDVKKSVEYSYPGTKVNYTKKDIQALMNQACGWYQLAYAHFINSSFLKNERLQEATMDFLGLFDDLDESQNWKKNEFVLKHFFLSTDEEERKKQLREGKTNVFPDPDSIDTEASLNTKDMKVPINISYK